MKKIILTVIMILSIITIGINCYATTEMIPLQESENYKGMSIIPEGVKNGSLIINYTLELQNNNSVDLSFNGNGNFYFVISGVYKETLNNVQNILTTKNNRNITYFIENYDYNVINDDSTINNNLRNFCCVKCESLDNNTISINNNSNLIFYDDEIDNNYKYTLNTIIYIPNIDENTILSLNCTTTSNYIYGSLTNYLWLYNYDGIYSYYNCNGFSYPYNVISNTNGYGGVLRSAYILQGSGNILDLQPTLSTFPYTTSVYYSMYNLNYLYGYLTSSDNKSFSNNIDGYVDLYYFGNNGNYSGLLQSQNNIYFYDDLNSAISNTYFNINFTYFAYCYSYISVDYHGGNINFNNLQINNTKENYFNSYFKDNTNYYSQNVGETNNTDLASDLGITYINCNWWNLKGQLNNLIYYIITGLPFLNNLYSLCLNIFSIGKIGFNFFTWSIPLASLLCFIIAIRIVFDKMMK